MTAGVTLNPATPVAAVREAARYADLLLCMSVNPGWGGQSFIEASVDRLRELTALLRPGMGLEVDGGVGPQTIERCRSAGANLMVAGSAIYDQPSPARPGRRSRRSPARERARRGAARPRARPGRARAPQREPEPHRRLRDRARRPRDRRGLARAPRATARRARRARRLQRAASRRDGLRLARAVQPSRPPAALRRCADRGRHRARRLRHPRSESAEVDGRGLERLREAGIEVELADGDARDAGAPPERGASGRTRPPAAVRAAQAGGDAGRAHRHEHGGEPLDLVAGEPQARARLARGVRRRRGRQRHGARRRSRAVAARCRASGGAPRRCAWCSTAAAVSRPAAGSRSRVATAPVAARGAARCAPAPAGRGARWRPRRSRRRSARSRSARSPRCWSRAERSSPAAFLRADLVDALALFIAPRLIGGDGRPLLGPLGVGELALAPRLLETSVREIGPDVLIEGLVQPLP